MQAVAAHPAMGARAEVAAGVAGPSSLLTGLVSYWPLGEASGTRADSVGGNDLTDNNTVTQGGGKIGNAADYVAVNSEYLSKSDNASLDFTTAFSFQAWIFGSSLTANACIAAKWAYATDGCWSIQVDGDGTGILIFVADAANDPGNNWRQFESASLTDMAWYHIVVTYAAGEVKLYVNGTEAEAGSSAGVIPVSLRNSGAELRLGSFEGLGRYWQGREDEAALWSRALTAGEVTTLFNSNSGLAPPF